MPLYTDEAGVRVLNPFDACGLELDLVLIGGLNAGVFPGDGGRDSVWTDPMITAVEGRLRALGVDAGLAWPTDAHRAQQERLLFFGAALSSTGGLVLSCQSHGEDGQVEVPSIFFEVPWYLAGWPSLPRLTDSALSRYERWRLERVPALVRAWARACQCGACASSQAVCGAIQTCDPAGGGLFGNRRMAPGAGIGCREIGA